MKLKAEEPKSRNNPAMMSPSSHQKCAADSRLEMRRRVTAMTATISVTMLMTMILGA